MSFMSAERQVDMERLKLMNSRSDNLASGLAPER